MIKQNPATRTLLNQAWRTISQDKIKAIDEIFASIDKLKQQDKQYFDIIAAADKLLADKSYQPAKVQYQSALKLKPDEKYPKDRVAEIDLALSDLAKQKALDDQYTAAISKADKSFALKTWEQAKTDYSAASALNPMKPIRRIRYWRLKRS